MKEVRKQIITQTVVILFGLFSFSTTGWFLYQVESEAIQTEFQKDVDVRLSSLYRQITFDFEALRPLTLLFKEREHPSFKKFTEEADIILTRHPDIQALEWIPYIQHKDRLTFEKELRAVIPEFDITERQAQGLMTIATKREDYYPVYYVAPISGNEAALGFDLGSSPVRRKALEWSRDTNTPQATAGITLVQGTGEKRAFLGFIPLYAKKALTANKLRESLTGFILGVYKIENIFNSSALGTGPLGIEMILNDETDPTKPDILLHHKSRTGGKSLKNFVYKTNLPEIWGRKWVVTSYPTEFYVASRRASLPWVAAISGMVFTLFIAFYIHIMSRRAQHVQELVDEQTKELKVVNEKLKSLTQTDGLTGLANRRYMDKVLEKEWRLAIRNKTPLSFVLMDIDHFKAFNDTYGHPAGDECLKKVASLLKKQVRRPSDLVARYGGEEFAIILPDTDGAVDFSVACIKAIEDLKIPHAFSSASEFVTISLGVCTLYPEEYTDKESIIEEADQALYRAKAKGRNTVENASAKEVIFRPKA